MIRVFVVDEHPIYVQGIKSAFRNKTEGVKVVGSATSAKEALKKLKFSRAKVILLNLLIYGDEELDLYILIQKAYPKKKIIIITDVTSPLLLINAWVRGVDAILSKHCQIGEIKAMIETVLDGKRRIDKEVPDMVPKSGLSSNETFLNLSRGERDTINALEQVGNKKGAAELLEVSQWSIDFHCRNIFTKLLSHRSLETI